MESLNCFVDVVSEPILFSKLMADMGGPECGAQVVFLGKVRNVNHGKKVVSVHYDAFEPLAKKTFLEIASEARLKWGLELHFAIVHRIGELKIGEESIAIIVNSKHRDEAYLASRYILEQIKTRAPVWKKEVYENGETEWLRGHALCGHVSRAQTSSP